MKPLSVRTSPATLDLKAVFQVGGLAGRGLISLLLVCCLLLLQLQGCSSRSISQAELDRLTQPEPDSVRQRAIRRITLASAYFAQEQMDAAMQETRAALQIDPDFAQAYSLLGLIHQRNNAIE